MRHNSGHFSFHAAGDCCPRDKTSDCPKLRPGPIDHRNTELLLYKLTTEALKQTFYISYIHYGFTEVFSSVYLYIWCCVSDLVFLQGTDVVLKVALVLLGNHKELIKQCDSFESVVEFLKTTLPEMGIIQIERIINEV